MTRLTLDSNVYLSALTFAGKPKRLLEMGAERQIEIAISDPIIHEVRRNLQTKFGWSESRAAEGIDTISAITKHVTPTETLDAVFGDPDDNRILECAVAAGSDVIVTGDSDLLMLKNFRGIRIANAADFLAVFQASGR